MDIKEKENRICGAIFGFAIGDSMGATTEFMTRKQIKNAYGKVTDLIGGGWLNLKPGEVTDDTQMSMCIMDVIMCGTHFNTFRNSVLNSFVDWYKSNPKDIGNQCRKAIEYYMKTGNQILLDTEALGNGGLMRAMPCAVLDSKESYIMNQIQNNTTHYNYASVAYIRRYTCIIKSLIDGRDIYVKLVNRGSNKIKLLEPSGCIENTFNNALFWAGRNSFENAIIGAVNHGGDADTIAAITGSLAGARYGFDSIPERWLEKLDRKVYNKLSEYAMFVCSTHDIEFFR